MLTGDFEALGRVIRQLEQVADVARQAAVQVAPELERVIDQQFDEGTSPAGDAWAPLQSYAHRKVAKGPPPLTDTREMRSTRRVTAIETGVVGLEASIEKPSVPRAPVRLDAKRRMLPRASEPLPKRWATPLELSITTAIRKHFEGGT